MAAKGGKRKKISLEYDRYAGKVARYSTAFAVVGAVSAPKGRKFSGAVRGAQKGFTIGNLAYAGGHAGRGLHRAFKSSATQHTQYKVRRQHG